VRIVAGALFGQNSPVRTFSGMFYADVALEAGAKVPLPAGHEERAIYVAQGAIEIAGDSFESGRLLVFRPGDEITVAAQTPSRLLFLGGEPMDGPRHIWWNFVSSSRERIEQAKEDWAQKRFDIVPGDEKEFIPLPS
jgi:redox-sensitive bicupin YhaK (pirin superfamily)